jgi:protein TonB
MLGLDLRRVGLFGVVLGIHAAAAAALLQMGFERRESLVVIPLETRIFQEKKRIEEPPPPILNLGSMQARIDVSVPVPQLQIEAYVEAPPSPRAPTATWVAVAPEESSSPVFVQEVQYLRAPKPRYPPLSRKLREEGVVVLKVLINERGEAEKIEIADSSGHKRLDAAAVEAVAAATFRPYLHNGVPRPMLVLVPIEFGLTRMRS